MKRFREVLARYAPPPPELGDRELPKLQVENLRAALKALSASNQKYFLICVGMLVAVFVGAIAVVALLLNDPKAISAVFGATGISVLGTIGMLSKLWKEKVAIDLTLVLVGHLSDEAASSVLDVILKKF